MFSTGSSVDEWTVDSEEGRDGTRHWDATRKGEPEEEESMHDDGRFGVNEDGGGGLNACVPPAGGGQLGDAHIRADQQRKEDESTHDDGRCGADEEGGGGLYASLRSDGQEKKDDGTDRDAEEEEDTKGLFTVTELLGEAKRLEEELLQEVETSAARRNAEEGVLEERGDAGDADGEEEDVSGGSSCSLSETVYVGGRGAEGVERTHDDSNVENETKGGGESVLDPLLLDQDDRSFDGLNGEELQTDEEFARGFPSPSAYFGGRSARLKLPVLREDEEHSNRPGGGGRGSNGRDHDDDDDDDDDEGEEEVDPKCRGDGDDASVEAEVDTLALEACHGAKLLVPRRLREVGVFLSTTCRRNDFPAWNGADVAIKVTTTVEEAGRPEPSIRIDPPQLELAAGERTTITVGLDETKVGGDSSHLLAHDRELSLVLVVCAAQDVATFRFGVHLLGTENGVEDRRKRLPFGLSEPMNAVDFLAEPKLICFGSLDVPRAATHTAAPSSPPSSPTSSSSSTAVRRVQLRNTGKVERRVRIRFIAGESNPEDATFFSVDDDEDGMTLAAGEQRNVYVRATLPPPPPLPPPPHGSVETCVGRPPRRGSATAAMIVEGGGSLLTSIPLHVSCGRAHLERQHCRWTTEEEDPRQGGARTCRLTLQNVGSRAAYVVPALLGGAVLQVSGREARHGFVLATGSAVDVCVHFERVSSGGGGEREKVLEFALHWGDEIARRRRRQYFRTSSLPAKGNCTEEDPVTSRDAHGEGRSGPPPRAPRKPVDRFDEELLWEERPPGSSAPDPEVADVADLETRSLAMLREDAAAFARQKQVLLVSGPPSAAPSSSPSASSASGLPSKAFQKRACRAMLVPLNEALEFRLMPGGSSCSSVCWLSNRSSSVDIKWWLESIPSHMTAERHQGIVRAGRARPLAFVLYRRRSDRRLKVPPQIVLRTPSDVLRIPCRTQLHRLDFAPPGGSSLRPPASVGGRDDREPRTMRARKPSLHFDAAELQFTGGTPRPAFVRLCNRTRRRIDVGLAPPAKPFSLGHRRLRLPPRSYIRLPVECDLRPDRPAADHVLTAVSTDSLAATILLRYVPDRI